MATSVTPLAEDEGVDVDGAVEAGGVAISIRGRLSLSCALLHRTVAASMAYITKKWGDSGKETEKWQSMCVIAEGKMSLSRVVVSL